MLPVKPLKLKLNERVYYYLKCPSSIRSGTNFKVVNRKAQGYLYDFCWLELNYVVWTCGLSKTVTELSNKKNSETVLNDLMLFAIWFYPLSRVDSGVRVLECSSWNLITRMPSVCRSDAVNRYRERAFYATFLGNANDECNNARIRRSCWHFCAFGRNRWGLNKLRRGNENLTVICVVSPGRAQEVAI